MVDYVIKIETSWNGSGKPETYAYDVYVDARDISMFIDFESMDHTAKIDTFVKKGFLYSFDHWSGVLSHHSYLLSSRELSKKEIASLQINFKNLSKCDPIILTQNLNGGDSCCHYGQWSCDGKDCVAFRSFTRSGKEIYHGCCHE